MTKIALSAGHHNDDGGNATEKALTGRWTPAIAAALRGRSFDLRVLQPADGAGDFDGGLAGVAQRVVAWANAGWVADVFLEIHGESAAQRGCFAIYPDWGRDQDIVTRDFLGPALARSIRDATGLPLRNGTGVMSEKQTGIGLGGNRLGIFAITNVPPLKDCRRLILECGSYGTAADKAIMTASDFPAKLAGAITARLALWFDLPDATPSDLAVIGVAPSITRDQWAGALARHHAPLSSVEADRVYTFCQWLEIDPAFLLALWKLEGGSPLGSSPLQQRTHQPINIRAAAGEWRPTVSANGSLWHATESFQLGCYQAALHLKVVHGWAGRTTVKAIWEVHAPVDDGNDPNGYRRILEDILYMRSH